MRSNSPKTPYFGFTEYDRLSPENQKQEFDDSATIEGYGVSEFKGIITADPWPELEYKVTMPKWTGEDNSQNVGLVKDWKEFYPKLKTHEDGHVKIGEDWATKGATLLNNGTFIVFAKDKTDAKELVKKVKKIKSGRKIFRPYSNCKTIN